MGIWEECYFPALWACGLLVSLKGTFSQKFLQNIFLNIYFHGLINLSFWESSALTINYAQRKRGLSLSLALPYYFLLSSLLSKNKACKTVFSENKKIFLYLNILGNRHLHHPDRSLVQLRHSATRYLGNLGENFKHLQIQYTFLQFIPLIILTAIEGYLGFNFISKTLFF